jgi:hypothetical protein
MAAGDAAGDIPARYWSFHSDAVSHFANSINHDYHMFCDISSQVIRGIREAATILGTSGMQDDAAFDDRRHRTDCRGLRGFDLAEADPWTN